MTRPITPEEAQFIRGCVIFEDAAILAFDKPAGLSSQGGRIRAATLDDMLATFAKPNGKRPRLVHRLDRDTSGVILAAKTQPAAAFLGRALMARRVKKTYLAVIAPGAPLARHGRIERALRRVEIGREARMEICAADHPDAESAVTGYRTLAAGDEAALVELRPRTGRMHQLRVHMASLGAPIAGDSRYGGALMLGGAAVPRLMLHASSLTFPHPDGGERTVAAPLTADMAAVLGRLGLAAPAPAAA